MLCHRHVANEFTASLIRGLLQRQCLVVDKPARTSEAAHVALLLTVGYEFVFEGLEPLHGLNYTLVYERQSKKKHRNSARKALRIPDARSLGLCDQVSPRGVYQSHSGRFAQCFYQRVHRLRGRTGGVRRRGRPCSLTGELPSKGISIVAGEQFEGCFQPDDSTEKLPQHSKKTLACGSL